MNLGPERLVRRVKLRWKEEGEEGGQGENGTII